MSRKNHCRSLSSIHILYNHTPTARLTPHPEPWCGLLIFHWTLPGGSHTGVVCENMQGLGAKLRKLPRQAKICTPPGGEVRVVCLDMFGHVWTCLSTSGHVRTRWTQVPLHAKICSGDLSGSGLRKYALRQNHTTVSLYGFGAGTPEG